MSDEFTAAKGLFLKIIFVSLGRSWERFQKKEVWLVPNDTVFCLYVANIGLMD
jgi:hypothetical protein